MVNKYYFLGALLVVSAITACDEDSYGSPTTPAAPAAQLVIGSGDPTVLVTEFRTLLGEPRNGGTVGPSLTGRREIGWDGVPAQFNNGDNLFPADFFNTTSKLGMVVSTPGTGFRNDTSLFGDLDASLRDQFSAFSPNKIFAASNSNAMDVHFRVPGLATQAVVAGFGAVFIDVDLPEQTTLEYFDRDGKSLGVLRVPVRTAASSFSFAGARFTTPVVARVRITLGTGALRSGLKDISAGGTVDAVVVDDFLYTEPQPF
jgi:hypothetical protein